MHSELDRILERARSGDEEAWRLLVDRLQNLVYSIPLRRHLSMDDAADVFMATFGVLHRDLDRVESGYVLPTWVAQIATRETLRLLRLRRNDPDQSLDDLLVDEEADVERATLRANDHFQIRAALDRLDEGCRDLLSALYADEASYTEITRNLGIPVGAIGPRRGRCLEKLRRMLDSGGFFDQTVD